MQAVKVKAVDTERMAPLGALTVDGIRYRFQYQIGVGAFTRVYKAADEWGNALAVKVYGPDVKVELWQNEVRQLRRFAGPGVVYLHRVFQHEGHTYLVMEDGGSPVSRYRFDSGAARIKASRFVAQGLLQVLHRLHAAGFYHGDINPQNLLLLSDQRQKLQAVTLVDFALCKSQRQLDAGVPVIAHWVPPPEYFSKALIRGPALDIWHSAVLLLQMIKGEMLDYSEEDVLAGLPRLEALDLDSPMAQVLATALDQDPSTRPDALGLWRRISSCV